MTNGPLCAAVLHLKHLRRAFIALALAGSACTVGAPLVDELGANPDGINPLQCNPPPRCDALPDVEAPVHVAEPVALTGCTRLCQRGSDEPLGDGVCPHEPINTLPVSAMCEDITLKGADSPAEQSLSALDWTDINLRLETERPLSVTLSMGRMARVFIELKGPITLRIAELEQLSDLRLQGIANDHGSPHVELASIKGERLSVGSSDAPFQGELTLRSLLLSDVDAYAEWLHVESGLIQQASLRADSLSMADVTLRRSSVEASKALLSYFDAEYSSLRFCGDARLIRAGLTRSALAACADSSLRVYVGKFGSSSLDGPVELSEVAFENVRLAANEPTRILAYDSTFESNQLCTNLELFAIMGVSAIKCSNCADELNVDGQQPTCAQEGSEALLANFCESWKDLDQLPVCSEDIPLRPHRIRM